MNRREVAAVLAMVSALDDRRVFGEVDVTAWEAVIGDLRFDDAREAVIRHYKEETTVMMPANVRRLVKLIRASRKREHPTPLSPYSTSDVMAHIEWSRAWEEAIADGLSPDSASSWASEQVGRMLTTPEGENG